MLLFELSHAEVSRTASSRKLQCEGQTQEVVCESQRCAHHPLNSWVFSERSECQKNLLVLSQHGCLK